MILQSKGLNSIFESANVTVCVLQCLKTMQLLIQALVNLSWREINLR